MRQGDCTRHVVHHTSVWLMLHSSILCGCHSAHQSQQRCETKNNASPVTGCLSKSQAQELALARAAQGSRWPLRVEHIERRAGCWLLLLVPVDASAPLGTDRWLSVYDSGEVHVEPGR